MRLIYQNQTTPTKQKNITQDHVTVPVRPLWYWLKSTVKFSGWQLKVKFGKLKAEMRI